MGWEIPLNDMVVTSARANGSGHVGLVAHRDGVRLWTVELDATGGDGALMARMERPRPVGSMLVVSTDGEHYRGASSHEPRVHIVDATGTERWWKPWRICGDVAQTRRGWVLFTIPSPYRIPAGEPVVVAYLVDPEDGAVKRSWDFEVSRSAAAELAEARWAHRTCSFERNGTQWTGKVEVQWGSKRETVRVRLKGAE